MNDSQYDWGGPYLQVAALCEAVLEEKNGILSFIRAFDRVVHTTNDPNSSESLPPFEYPMVLAVTLKSGRARGRSTVKIEPYRPDGTKMSPIQFPALFEGDDRGVNLVLNMVFKVEQEGLYWFHVSVDERLLTRIPLRILYQRVPGQIAPSGF